MYIWVIKSFDKIAIRILKINFKLETIVFMDGTLKYDWIKFFRFQKICHTFYIEILL